MDDRKAPASPAIIGRLASAAARVNAMLPVVKGDFITPDGEWLVDHDLLCLNGCDSLLCRAAALGPHHEFSRTDRDKLGAGVAVPENQSLLLLRISKAGLFNYRRIIFQAGKIGNWYRRRRYMLRHRCGLLSYRNWLGLRFNSGRFRLHFRL